MALGEVLISDEFIISDDILISEATIDPRTISVPARILRSLTEEEFIAFSEQLIGGNDAEKHNPKAYADDPTFIVGRDLHDEGDVDRCDRDAGFRCHDWHRLLRYRRGG